MSADWKAGDQAMCVKPFGAARALGPDGTLLPDDQRPRPPLVYSVVDVFTPGDFPNYQIKCPAPAYLVLAEAGKHPSRKARASFDCRHFRKLPPLAPDQIDSPERVPVAA